VKLQGFFIGGRLCRCLNPNVYKGNSGDVVIAAVTVYPHTLSPFTHDGVTVHPRPSPFTHNVSVGKR
jgi:hypothetical protein